MHTHDRIWVAVKRIPRGSLATYGDIARVCRLAGQARLVGYALHSLPAGSDIPWHRVVNARGEISLRGEAGRDQRRLLEAEGVIFERGKTDLGKYRHVRPRPRRRGHTRSGHARRWGAPGARV